MRAEQTTPPVADRFSLKPLFIYVALFFAVWSLRATVLYSIDRGIQPELAKRLYSEAAKILIWTVPVFIYLRVRGENSLAFLKLNTPIRLNALVVAILLSAAYLGGMLLFAHFVEGKNLSALTRAGGAEILLALLNVSVSPVSEEILFRGFILTTLRERLRFVSANLITSLLFTMIHWPYHLWAGMPLPRLAMMSVSLFIIGYLLGYLVKLTNSLWPSVGAHVANNFLVSFLRP
ncbi:MAG TPA: type II CAAX endopeptidase family protein [Blastocatellia bacterium]|nr:type II CAAX endopeptidase family protein [Blastocatellia bacterium]